MFQIGDRVRIVKDDAGCVGRVGTVTKYDGSEEGFWPWRVDFSANPDDYDWDIFNADELEHVKDEEPAPAVKETKLEHVYIEGYLIVDDENNILTAWNTYDKAHKEAKSAAAKLETSLYIYKMVTAFEVEPRGPVVVVETAVS